MAQHSPKDQESYRRHILEKAKTLFHSKTAGSNLRQQDLGLPATETSAQAAARVPADQGVNSSPHTTDTAAHEAANPFTTEVALNTQPTEAEAILPAAATSPLLSSKNAPIWNQALEDFRQNYGEEYGWLVAGVSRDDNSCIQQWNGLFDPVVPSKLVNQKSDKQGYAFMQRLDTYLPSLSLVKGVTMPLAALDPHKVAPAVCAGVFFAIEFVLNQMRPEDRDTTLKILFETAIAINEWITFESLFARKENPAITTDLRKLNELLPSIYSQALLLLANIQHSCDQEGFKSRLEKLRRTIEKWKGAAEDLKRDRDRCSSLKKRIEDELAAVKNRTEVLQWIKVDDPELRLGYILENGPSEAEDREQKYGQWFLDSTEFKGWANGFRRVGNAEDTKRVLWIHGNYGTGKSTLVRRVISILQEEAENRSLENTLRIIPYFCSASSDGSKRPDYQTIIRSLAQKLSWMPDCTVAPVAQSMYDAYDHATKPLVSTLRWEELLNSLISEIPDESVVVFLIDALDECSSPDEVEKFLHFTADMVQKSANIQILISSRQHVNVQRHFKGAKKSLLYGVEIRPERTKLDMARLIEREIQRRRPTEYDDEESVFFNPQHQDMLKRLEKLLKSRANGMFIWVNIWLDLLLPAEPIDLAEIAEELLNELETSSNDWVDNEFKAGYQRLWDANNRRGYGDYQIRLFQFVLGSMVPLTTDHVTSAMRIKVDGSGLYNKELMSRQVKRLYANFLLEDGSGYLQFAHSTAKSFILKMDAKEEGTSLGTDSRIFSVQRIYRNMMNTCLAILKDREHPAWHLAGPVFNQSVARLRRSAEGQNHMMEKFTEAHLGSISLFGLQTALHQTQKADWDSHNLAIYRGEIFTALSDGQDSFAFYVLFFWLDYFNDIYQRKTIFDPEWVDFLDTIVLAPKSAFSGAILANLFFCPEPPRFFGMIVFLRKYVGPKVLFPSKVLRFENDEGSTSLLYLHILAAMFSMMDSDFSIPQLETFARPIDDGKHSRLKRLLHQNRLKNANGESALYLACQYNNTAVLKLLLEGTRFLEGDLAAWSLLFPEHHRETPLECIYPSKSVPKSTTKVLLDFEERMAKAHPEQFGLEQRQLACDPSTNILHIFRRSNEDSCLLVLMFAKPEEYNLRDRKQNTALHIAAGRGFVSIMEGLVERRGADINAKNARNETPLHRAARERKLEAIKYLLDRPGIKPAEVSNRGETALTIAKAKVTEANLYIENKLQPITPQEQVEEDEEMSPMLINPRKDFMEMLQKIVNLLEEAESSMSAVDRSVERRMAS